jgi:hypothetical protein
LTLEHINNQVQALSSELSNAVPEISNLDQLLSASLEKLSKLSQAWTSSDLEK